MVAQVIRYWPEYRAAREIIRSGELGAVRAASLSRRCAVPSWSKWMHDPANSGGGVFDLLIHDFDYCLQLFGRPQSISAVGVEAIDKGIDVSEARLHYENNMPVTISGGWQPSAYPFSMAFSITCDDGVLDFDSGLPAVDTLPRRPWSGDPRTPANGRIRGRARSLRGCLRAGRGARGLPSRGISAGNKNDAGHAGIARDARRASGGLATGRWEKIRDCHKRRPRRHVESMTTSAAVDCPQHFFTASRNPSTCRVNGTDEAWSSPMGATARSGLARSGDVPVRSSGTFHARKD